MKRSPFNKREIGDLPILHHTHIANGRATNTDLDIFASYDIPYTGPAILVPHSIIEKALKVDKKAFIEPDGKAISAGILRIPFTGPDVADFPDPMGTIEAKPIELPGFAAAVQKVKYAMADQDLRYFLNGFCLEVTDKTITVVAIDGHRMEYVELDYVEGIKEGSHIFPRSVVKHINSNVLQIGDNAAQIGTGIHTKLIDGTFPNWRRTIPECKELCTVDRAEFEKVLKALLPFTNSKYQGIKISYEKDRLFLTAASPDNEPVEAVLSATCSAEMVAGYNATYLIDAVKTAGDVLEIKYSDANTPIVIDGGAVVTPMGL